MIPEIAILVPQKKSKYNYTMLEALLGQRQIKSKTFVPNNVLGTNRDLIISIGDPKSFRGIKNKYDRNFAKIGYFNTKAWIYCIDCTLSPEDTEEFLDEYSSLLSTFANKMDGLTKKDLKDYWANKVDKAILLLQVLTPIVNLVILEEIIKESIKNKGNKTFGESFKTVLRDVFKGNIIPLDHLYRFAILKFIDSYLDEFLAENGFHREEDNSETAGDVSSQENETGIKKNE